MDLFFYDVDEKYVAFLQEQEKKKRGFTRVLDIVYKNSRKMVCGIVLMIGNFKYYVPISSYKIKQKKQHSDRIKG